MFIWKHSIIALTHYLCFHVCVTLVLLNYLNLRNNVS